MHLLNLSLPAWRWRPRDPPEQVTRSRPSSWSASPASPPSGSAARSAPTPSRTLELHPLLNPAAYVDAPFSTPRSPSRSPAHEDGGWITLCGPDSVRPLQAAVRGVDPHLDVEVTGTDTDWTATVVRRDEPAPDPTRSR